MKVHLLLLRNLLRESSGWLAGWLAGWRAQCLAVSASSSRTLDAWKGSADIFLKEVFGTVCVDDFLNLPSGVSVIGLLVIDKLNSFIG